MTLTLTPELERAVEETARKGGLTAEAVVLETLREKFLPAPQSINTGDALDEWEQMMRGAAAQLAEVPGSEHAGLAEFEKELR